MSETIDLFEGKAAWMLSKLLPPETPCLSAAVCLCEMWSSSGVPEILELSRSSTEAQTALMGRYQPR
jgi:hypothetical protein